MTQEEAALISTDLISLYRQFGSRDYIGEPVSQLEHMSQTAEFAIQEGADHEVILAAFFHDIGHLCVARTGENDMSGLGTIRHEKVGADFLRVRGYPERVSRLVELHVQAKRFLTFYDPLYYASLSDASKKTLALQGGVMTKDEATEFRNDPLFTDAIRLRKWDEAAKVPNMPLIDLNVLDLISRQVLSNIRV